jgi:aquaporin TIP
MDKNLRAYLAEFVGTFAVVFLTAGVICVNHLATVRSMTPELGVIVQPAPGLFGIALVAGLSYAVALAMTLPYAGGFLNPSITLTLWVLRRLDGGRAAAFISVQLLAGVVAGMLLRFIMPEDLALVPTRIGTPHVSTELFDLTGSATIGATLGGLAIETIITALVTFVIFATLLDTRLGRLSQWGGKLAALWVGLMVVAVTYVAHRLTGAAINPARWFGTVVWEMSVTALQLQRPFQDHLVYWLGPTMGALIAGSIYSAWIMPSEEDQRRPHQAPAETVAKKK